MNKAVICGPTGSYIVNHEDPQEALRDMPDGVRALFINETADAIAIILYLSRMGLIIIASKDPTIMVEERKRGLFALGVKEEDVEKEIESAITRFNELSAEEQAAKAVQFMK